MTVPHVELLGPAEIRQLAELLDVSPTKKLGQNFVHDPNTVRRIVAAADLPAGSSVIEVGPGLGSLTLALLEGGHSVHAVELDPRLAAHLPTTVAERAPGAADSFSVIHEDALKVTAAQLGNITPNALVANLPYNVSVPVLLHLLAEFPSIERVLVMVQLEVAERLSAKPGTKIYGVPSVKASFYGEVSLAGKIGKNVFWPAPNIDSGLVRIERYPASAQPWPQDAAARARVFPLIDAAFAQRRKTLRAALAGVFGGGDAAAAALEAAGIAPTQRGEKLSCADFVRLAQVAHERGLIPGADTAAGETEARAGAAGVVRSYQEGS